MRAFWTFSLPWENLYVRTYLQGKRRDTGKVHLCSFRNPLCSGASCRIVGRTPVACSEMARCGSSGPCIGSTTYCCFQLLIHHKTQFGNIVSSISTFSNSSNLFSQNVEVVKKKKNEALISVRCQRGTVTDMDNWWRMDNLDCS